MEIIREAVKRALYDGRKYPDTENYNLVLLSEDETIETKNDDGEPKINSICLADQ